ncbi:MAG: hypothetical protein IKZ26_07355, partial [Peptococcaceae bacterium]|nr:hypothetical protein [Peptococcaceae bacterium]
VDAIVLSHGDTDHISGLQQVIEAVPVTYLCMEHSQLERDEVQPLLDTAEACGVSVKPVGSEAELYLKEWEIQLAVYDDRQNETNSRELTAVLKNEKNAIVFPGDLGVDAVHQFLKSQPYITVWTVPHHGSRYSASPILYEELQRKGVKLAVISAGAENRYGHPHDEVLRYLQEQNIPVYRIDQNGALMIRTDAL